MIIALFVGFMFVSCNDEDYGILEHKNNGVVDLYATYSYLGEIHNDFQTNVAGDAAGAIVGAVGSAVASAVTGDEITGKSVGKSAVSGALVASTGAVNKVANVLSKLFR
ncbi:MAG: hypothetical protein KIG93_08745 [Prevotella sp.]|nr:hypothetical protein [Prevotella sp.]MBS7314100.1 hypothetical protein [Bacteroidales bacterium]